jgi:UDP-N-acetylglucosamine 2-epimerase (non-hydrolysing)
MEAGGLYARLEAAPGVTLTEPLDYLSFLSLVASCQAVLTDSGGIQEETTYLHIPCITLRPNTERPSTVEIGTNELVTPSGAALLEAFERLASGAWKKGAVPPLWDGHAAERVLNALEEALDHAVRHEPARS